MQRPDKTYRALFYLLRSGLWGKLPEDLPFPELSTAEWQQVFRLAVEQSVTGIAYGGLCLLPDSLQPEDGLAMRWVAEVEVIGQKNRKMEAVLAALSEIARTGGLHPVLLKGHGVARHYPSPGLRECGDIDLYFPDPEDRKRLEVIMAGKGCRLVKEGDGSTCYSWEGILIEHHPQLLDINSPGMKQFLAGLEAGEGFVRQPVGTSQPVEMELPSPLLELLLLNAHILKHLMGHGIGLRQFCDITCSFRQLKGRYDPETYRQVCRRSGLARWNRELHAFATGLLGLPEDDLPYRDKADTFSPVLWEMIAGGGNFGRYGRSRRGKARGKWRGKWRTFRQLARNSRYFMRLAPREYLGYIFRLLAGSL